MLRLHIKELAQAQKINQQTLAEMSDVSVTLMGRYWNNRIQRVDLVELGKIAKALGVSPLELFEEVKEPSAA